MKRLTAATAAAAAACAQRHEMRRQRRKDAELYEALRLEKNRQYEELYSVINRFTALNQWMMTNAFDMSSRREQRFIDYRNDGISFMHKAWPRCVPVEAIERRHSWEMDRFTQARMKEDPFLRATFRETLARTLAMHVEIALLECDGRTHEAELLRRQINKKPI